MKLSLISAILAAATLSVAGCGKGGVDMGQLGDAVGGQWGHGIKALGHAGNAVSLSEEDEDALGQSVGISLTNTYQVTRDTNLIKYVNFVGLTVAMGSDDPNAKYVFAVLETNEVNAWSGPGGYVFITRGVINNCQDEAELAGVLAHEIAHVNHRDGLEEVKQAELRAAAAQGMQAHGKTAGFAGMADMGVEVMTKQGHSQPSELKADAAAVRYLSAAGYDPASYLRFLQRLQQLSSRGGQLMSTHPGIGQRVQTVANALRSVKQGGQTLAPRFNAWVRPAAPAPR